VIKSASGSSYAYFKYMSSAKSPANGLVTKPGRPVVQDARD
jgi:hypothetical protein